jgi:hypothetical protein
MTWRNINSLGSLMLNCTDSWIYLQKQRWPLLLFLSLSMDTSEAPRRTKVHAYSEAPHRTRTRGRPNRASRATTDLAGGGEDKLR